MSEIFDGGNGIVYFWAFLIGYFLLCIIFPDCFILRFLTNLINKLMKIGGRQRW
jgi:hypothetical protein